MTLFLTLLGMVGAGGIGAALLGYGPAMLLIARGVVRWLSERSLAELACIALALALAVQTVRLHHAQGVLAKARSALKAEKAGRAADRASYVKAQADAAAKNKAEVKAKEAQSQRISDNAKTAYERDLADLHRLRQRTAQGSPGKPGTSKDGAAAAGADGADQLPLPPQELLRAQEIELQLMHLQGWVSDQLKAQQ
jgi:hypothetical protein